MLLSAVSVLVVAQSSSEIPEGLMNNPVYNALPQPELLHEQTSMLRYTYIVRLASTNLYRATLTNVKEFLK